MGSTLYFGVFRGVARAAEPEEVSVRGGEAGGFVAKADERRAPREITDAASLVSPLPGVHVRRLGGDDAFATISIRGSSSSQVAISLAGVPLTGGADPSLDLATLPLWPGIEARAYRSFAPATIGQGSLGGTLAIAAPRVAGPARTEVWSAVGSFGAMRLRAADSRSLGEGELAPHVTTAISANRSDGDFTYVDPLAAAAGTERTQIRENASVSAANGLVSWSLPVKTAHARAGRITALVLLQGRRQGNPGTTKAPTTTETLSSGRAVGSIELALPLFAESTAYARLWGRRDALSLRARPDEAIRTLTPSFTDDTVAAAGGSLGLRARPHPRARVDLRLDGQGERFAPGTWEGATSPAGATRAQTGVGTDLDLRPHERVTLAASGRVDVWHDTSNDALTRSEDAARATGHMGAEATFGPVVLATHVGHLARAPGFVERYGNRGMVLGSPDLRPEAATTLDAGAKIGGARGALRGYAELTGFSTWADDLIVLVPQGAYGRARATNVGEARIAGLEALVDGKAGPFDSRVSYTYLATANDTTCDVTRPSAGPCAPAPLPGRPGHDLVVDVGVTIGPARLRYGLDVVADLRADLSGAVTVPPRALQSVGARVTLPYGPHVVTFALDVSNLFDVRAASYAGLFGPVREPIGDLYEYPLPGRAFLASVRLTSPR